MFFRYCPRPGRLAAVLVSALLLPGAAAAQIIPLRTVPVASGDQFFMQPSAFAGMGGVRVAVTDSLAGGWVNPALGTVGRESWLTGAPTRYGISSNGGSGTTLPFSVRIQGERTAVGVAVALQQIDNSDAPRPRFWTGVEPEPFWSVGGVDRLSDRSARNLYANAFVSRALGARWSLGVGASAASLEAMDGVDLLYANAADIRQSGSLAGVRVGVRRDGRRDDVELLLLHDRVDMRHDVRYDVWRWMEDAPPEIETSIERNEDRTRTWGLHGGWARDLSAPGWRVGASGTVNRKTHPKIPNYELQNIPRDPGETWAYELAAGISRQRAGTTFAMDVVFQPSRSDTWQEADEPTTAVSGRIFQPGDRTIENDFSFTNVVLRTGFGWTGTRFGAQGGVEVRSYGYDLEQVDHVRGSDRSLTESWVEWTPTLGATWRLADVELRYTGRLTTGTGRPGIADELAIDALNSASDFLVAPQGPLTLQDAHVTTHQIAVKVPIR